jgi:alkylation response protein AidB-like acyl-CoA dehydrogenase
MSLLLNEEQVMLRDSARSFLAEVSPVSELRRLRDSHDASGFSRQLWSRFAEMGYCGLLVPEAFGGAGLGLVEAGVLMEEIGHTLCASPFLASSVLAVTALRHSGSQPQQAQWLPRLATGACIGTLAVDEHNKHRPEALTTQATRQGNGYRLSGAKCLVLDGHVAELLIVAARTSDSTVDAAHGVSLFLVPAATPGVTVLRTVMVDAHNAARLRFDNVELPADALLGTWDADAATLQATLDAGRAAVAAELLGIADEVFTRTLAYLKERRQFGKPIGEFQGLQHRAATLYVDIELSRAALIKALTSLDTGEGAANAVAVAKAKCGNTATLAVQEGVQMHGGMGMTDEFEIGFFMKRARVLQELFGDPGFQMDRLARLGGY